MLIFFLLHMICQTLVADSFYVLSNSFFTTTNTFVAEVEAKLRSLSKSSSSSTVFLKDFFFLLHFPVKCGKAKLQSYK